MVIYVDVLFIINFFINFLLLGVTSKLSKMNGKTYRLIIASVVGGLYSFVILIDDLETPLLVISKIFVAFLMLIISFNFKKIITFFKVALVFAFSNSIFLGSIIGVCIVFKPSLVAVKNSIVYFDVSSGLLIGCALLAYLISSLVIKLHNRKLSKEQIYTITIVLGQMQRTMYAFLDTGNHLREPFSDTPVIIAKKDKLDGFLTDNNTRLVPTSTVNGSKLLCAFKADKIIIKSSSNQEEVAFNIYVAFSDNIKSDSYSAILNADILHI